MISVTVNANDTLSRLAQFAAGLKDRTVPNRQLGAQLQSWVFRNFQQEGGLNVPWTPLKDSTANKKVTKSGKRRGYHPILIVTGNMRNKFLPFSDNDQAGIGVRASQGVDYAEVHENGAPSRNIPARPMLPPVGEALKLASRVYELRILTLRQQATL